MIKFSSMRSMMAVALAAGLVFSVGCASSDGGHGSHGGHAHVNAWANVTQAVAVIIPTKGNTTAGTITFAQTGDTVTITGTVSGLTPGDHAMHIHEFGDASSADGAAAGGHYNPEGHAHGAPSATVRHAGDFGNITADASGNATINITVNNLTIAGLKNPIVGRGLIIHAKPDDFTQPVGNAGPRVGVGVIGIAKTPAPAK